MTKQFKVGDKVRFTEEFLQTMPADHASLSRGVYVIEETHVEPKTGKTLYDLADKQGWGIAAKWLVKA